MVIKITNTIMTKARFRKLMDIVGRKIIMMIAGPFTNAYKLFLDRVCGYRLGLSEHEKVLYGNEMKARRRIYG